jgi:UDP-glucose 4-epimerase
MAAAVGKLLKLGNEGYDTFNLGRGIEYSVVEIVEAFEKQLNEKIIIEIDPARVRKVEREHLVADILKLKTVTGWEPTWGIDEGIKNLVNSWAK